MDKKQAIKIITECAKIYDTTLSNQNVLFVYDNSGEINYIETVFRPINFMHLTGIVTANSKLNSTVFYKKCIESKLSINDFDFNKNGTTQLKLSILKQSVAIDKNAKMIGNYNNSGIDLLTSKIVGNIALCLGFIKSEKSSYYVPNTLLNEDIRQKADKPVKRILFTLKKNIYLEKYNIVSYVGKNVKVNELLLPEKVLQKISNEIKEQFGINRKISS